MELLADILKMLLPATLVLIGVYITVRTLIVKQLERDLINIRSASEQTTLPLRLQAYERLSLFLERINPTSLVIRANNPEFNVLELKLQLLNIIGEELNHNLSQQIYVSEELWAIVKASRDNVLTLIETAADNLEPQAPSMALIEQIFGIMVQSGQDPTAMGLNAIRAEAKQLL
jgi:hypothetical protein